MRDGHVLDRRELEAEELAGHPEHALAQLLELQVGLHLVLVEVVLRLAHLLGVVAVVPGRDLDPGALLVGDRLHVGDLFVDARHRRRPDRLHQLHGPLGASAMAFSRRQWAWVGVAEQPGALGAQLQDLGDDRVVVVGVAVVAAAVVGAPDLLPQVAPVGVGQERLHAGAGVEDRPLAVSAPGTRRRLLRRRAESRAGRRGRTPCPGRGRSRPRRPARSG